MIDLQVALSHVLIERAKLESDFKKINLIIHNNNVDAIVIGLPLNKNGTKGRQAQSVITFASNLNKKIGLPILMWDERFSTEGIQREMLNNGLKKKNLRNHVSLKRNSNPWNDCFSTERCDSV